eukprot:SAG11_NODE_1645_length_4524_cov_7.819435_1_plen_152_part_10
MNLISKPSGHTGTYNGVRFTFANEIITIEIGDAMTNTWEVLATGHFIKPINYSNCALYPKVFIPDGRSCIITTKGRVEDYYSSHANVGDLPYVNTTTQFKGSILKASLAAEDNRDSTTLEYNNRGLSTSTPGEQQHIPYDCVLISSYVDPSK